MRLNFKLYYLLLSFIFITCLANAQKPKYFAATIGSYSPISGNIIPYTSNCDDCDAIVNLGFTINFNGNLYSSINVSTNGTISLNQSFHSYTNYFQNYSGLDLIAPFWADLQSDSSSGPYSTAQYLIEGTEGNKKITIQWDKFQSCCDFIPNNELVSFQVILYESNNNIEFHYKKNQPYTNSFDHLIVEGDGSYYYHNTASVGLKFLRDESFLSVNELSTNALLDSLNPIDTVSWINNANDGLVLIFSTNPIPPTFANPGPIAICQKGSYFLDPSTTTGTWLSSDPAVATVDSRGYVTGLITGTTTISLENGGGTATATITVGFNSEFAITDTSAQSSYKFNNNYQGPIGGKINYVGYNGYNYSSQIRPINTGFYRASNQSMDNAGCPYEFYIFRCTTCGNVSGNATRPQGTFSGNIIQFGGRGQLIYTSSNEGGPFTIVYQSIGGALTTVNHITSGVPFNVASGAPTNTTAYKLVSVTDETSKSSTDFSNVIGIISVVQAPTVTLSGELTICPGTNATLTLTTTGTGAIAVTLNDGTIVNTASGTSTFSVSPTINTTYTISSVVGISGIGTFDGTASVTINDTGTPVITSTPTASITINEGTSTTLSVTTSGATGYQWYQDGIAIEGANTISYTTTNTLSATGTYYVMVYGACSSITSTNTVVTISQIPQGSLRGSSIAPDQTGHLSYTSSNYSVGGPFTIVYQPEEGAEVTVTNVTSGVPFDVELGTPSSTTTYTLISVTDESSTLSRTFDFIGATATITIVNGSIGDSYGGGIIAYILQPEDPGYIVGEKHGIIAATEDQSTGSPWVPNSNYTRTGAIGKNILTGRDNTAAIFALHGDGNGSYAAKIARDYRGGDYSDWYLPSQDELTQLFINQNVLGNNFSLASYWSSSEEIYYGTFACYRNFQTGGVGCNANKSVWGRVRAVRSF